MNTERAAEGIGALLAVRFLRDGTAVSDEAPKALAERTGRRSEPRAIAAGISSERDTHDRADFPRRPFTSRPTGP